MNLILNCLKKNPKSSEFDPIIHEFAQLVITTSFIYKTHERKKLSIDCSQSHAMIFIKYLNILRKKIMNKVITLKIFFKRKVKEKENK
jgi:hypothetical protein